MGNLFSSIQPVSELYEVKMGEKRELIPSDVSDSNLPEQKKPRLTEKDVTLEELCNQGMVIKDRYVVQKVIGEGSFGKVLKVTDQRTEKSFAMKVIKDTSNDAKTDFVSERDVLKKIKTKDPKNISRLIILESTFAIGDHWVLLFDLYPLSLHDYTKKIGKGAPFIDIKNVTYQILQALQFLAKLRITHGDLKPENIMIVDESTLQIKVIDLGCAFRVGERPYNYFQTRYYRSPEVMFGTSYDNAVDIWSLACIMFEMRTKMPLFKSKCEVEHLRKVIEVLGMPPPRLLREGTRTEIFFEGRKRNQFMEEEKLKPRSRSLYKLLCQQERRKQGLWRYCQGDLRSFVELLRRMLNYERQRRVDAEDAMKHRFFKTVKNELENGGVYTTTT